MIRKYSKKGLEKRKEGRACLPEFFQRHIEIAKTKCCANCPYFEDSYEMPLKMNDFTLVNCVLEPNNKFPSVVPAQTYVLTANMTGRCNLSASIVVQTERID